MAGQVTRALKIYVGNLPWTVGHRELSEYFSRFGHINTARVVFDHSTGFSRRYGFVLFSNRNGYDNALSRENHYIEGSAVTLEPTST